MRKMTVILGLFVGGLCLADLATGQPGAGGFGGGGAFGGKGAVGTATLTLFNNASVKKELDVTDDQTAAVPEAILKALGGVLNEKQFKRFKQIELQQRGAQAFADAKIQGDLKLTATQKDNVKTILDDNAKELKEILAAGGFGGAGGKGGKGGAGGAGGFGINNEKTDNLKKETLEKLTGVLTLDQKTTWKSLNGDSFKLEQPFGGAGGAGGFGGKGGKGKKGAE